MSDCRSLFAAVAVAVDDRIALLVVDSVSALDWMLLTVFLHSIGCC